MGSFEGQVDSLSTLASSWCLCLQECRKGVFNNKIIFFLSPCRSCHRLWTFLVKLESTEN